MTNLIKTPSFPVDLLSDFVDRLEVKYPESRSNGYPPYNVWVDSDNESLKIEIAVSGFSKSDLTINFDGQVLTVSGERKESVNNTSRKWLHQGLAKRKFSSRFKVNGSFLIESATIKDGILLISFKKESKQIQIEIVEESTTRC